MEATVRPGVPESVRADRISPTAVRALLGALVVATLFQVVFLPAESPAALLLALVLSLAIVARARRDEDGNAVVLAWAVRLLVGLVFSRFMAGMAGGLPDWIAYDRGGQLLVEAIRNGQAPPGFSFGAAGDNVSTFVGYVYAVVGRSMPSVVVFETMFGLLSSWIYLRACRILVPRVPAAIRYGILFFPSFVFWTSILGKDPFVSLGLALGVYGGVAFCSGRGRALTNVALMTAAVSLCLLFRPHLVLILVPALMAGMLFTLLRRPTAAAAALPGGRIWGRRLVAVTTLVGCIVLAPALAKVGAGRLWVEEGGVDAWMAKAGEQRVADPSEGGGSNTGFSGYTSLPGYLRALPASMTTLFFRPLLWEVHNAAAAVAAVDTLLVSAVCVWLLVSAVKRRGGIRRRRSESAIGFLLVWLAAWVLMFVNMTGNLGTMVRQRVQIIPVILLLAGVEAGLTGGLAQERREEGAEGLTRSG